MLCRWDYRDPLYNDVLYYLDELKREGKIRHVGLSNFNEDKVREVLANGFQVCTLVGMNA
jgi:aryl-alcohol dehydrogenase-like predicted oxidoreductase